MTKLDIAGSLRPTTRDGRDRLFAKLAAAIDAIARVRRFNDYAMANLTATQRRCTELLEQRRALAGDVLELLNALEESRGVPTMRVRVAASLVRQTLRFAR